MVRQVGDHVETLDHVQLMMPRTGSPSSTPNRAATPVNPCPVNPRTCRTASFRPHRQRVLAALLAGSVLAACSSDASDAENTTTTAEVQPTTTSTTTPSWTDADRASVAALGRAITGSLVGFDFTTFGRPDDSRGIPTFAEPGVRPEPRGYRGVLGALGPDDIVIDDDVVVEAYSAPPAAAPGTDPLTGLPTTGIEFTADTIGIGTHNAVVIKVDNAPPARPQVGLNRADIVFEEEVEGGITRFAAVFHSQLGPVGPIRSGRTSDISILASLGSPSLVYSGANDVFDALLISQPMVHNFSETRTAGFSRNASYRFPSNLFSTVDNFAQPTRPPPPQFFYDADADRSAWVDTSSVLVDWGSTSSGWSWDAETAHWLRLQNGRSHQTDDGQVSATNVVVVTVEEVSTGLTDSIGTPIPEYVFVGTGPATVFVDGRALEGTWTRPTLRDQAAFTAPDGTPIALDPGRTWVELVVAGSTSWS